MPASSFRSRATAVYTCTSNGTVPNNAKVTEPYFTDNYWKHPENPAAYDFDPSVPFGVPFAPSPFRVTFTVKAGSVEVTRDLPIEYRYVKDIYFGDKRMELNVVPAFSVTVTPELATRMAQVHMPASDAVAITIVGKASEIRAPLEAAFGHPQDIE